MGNSSSHAPRLRKTLRSLIAAITAVLVAGSLGLMGALPAQASAGDGTISGVVKAGGTPLAGIEIYAFDGMGAFGPATTDIAGEFVLTNVPAGSYTVSFQDPALAYSNTQFTSIVVIADEATVQNASLSVRPNYTLQGRVTDSLTGDPVQGMTISANPEPYDSAIAPRNAVTDLDGNYVIDHLASSHVSVSSEYGHTSYRFFRTDGIGVNSTPTTFNFTLSPVVKGIGVISGVVRDYATGEPLLDSASVYLSIPTGGGMFDSKVVTSDPTDGSYEATEIPFGTINVSASGPYGSDYMQSQSVPIALTEAAPIRTRDIYLKKLPRGSSTITGTLTEEGPGGILLPVTQAFVNVSSISGGMSVSYPGVSVEADGSFAVDRLPAGIFNISVMGPMASPYKPVNTTVTVDGVHDLVFDVLMERVPTGSGAISGTLTDRRTHLPLANVSVTARLQGQSSVWRSAATDSVGNWSVVDLPDGVYNISFWDFSQTLEREENTPSSTIVAGGQVDRVDTLTSLAPGTATLSGRIKNATNYAGIDSVNVTLHRISGGTPPIAVTSDSLGNYRISSIPSGQYSVEVFVDGYATANESVDIDAGESATLGVWLTPRPIVPSGSGKITGIVLDSHGQPLANASVNAYAVEARGALEAQGWGSATTDADGVYVLEDLALTDFALWVNGPYSDSSLATQSATVSLSLANQNVVKDFALHMGATISGVVTTGDGKEPTGVNVFAIDSLGYLWSSPLSDSGSYSISRLAAGTYTVWVGLNSNVVPDAGAPSYSATFWSGSSIYGSSAASEATSFTVAAGDVSSGHDVELRAGGKISGTVSVSAGNSTATLPQNKNVLVNVYRQDGAAWVLDTLIQAQTAASTAGNFELSGLSAGNYKLEFQDDWTGNRAYEKIYNSGASTLADAPTITVASGATVAGQNVMMKTKVPTGGSNTVNSSDLTGGTEGGVGAPGTAAVDETITVDVGSDMAGEWVSLWAHSTPTALGDWVEVPANGKISAKIPSTLPAGNHRIVVQDVDDAVVGWSGIVISAASAGGTGSTGSSAGGSKGSVGGGKATATTPGVHAPTSNGTAAAPSSPALPKTAESSSSSTPSESAPATKSDAAETAVTPVAGSSTHWGLTLSLIAGFLVLGTAGGIFVMVRSRRA